MNIPTFENSNLGGKIIIGTFAVLVLLISGCSTDIPYEPPTKVETDAASLPVSASGESELEPVTEFKIGETATDNELRISVNSVEFKRVITYNPGFTTIPIEAGEGKVFAIVDVTIENILTDVTQTPNLFLQSSLADQDSYNYEAEITASVALDKAYDNGDILPGMKKRGKAAYSVPEGATDLKFIFKFDIFQGKTVIFDIK